jgi:hypothetical protein
MSAIPRPFFKKKYMKTKATHTFLLSLLLLSINGISQTSLLKDKQMKFNLSEDGKQYLRLTFLNQTWVRFTDANPGTTTYGFAQDNIFDIGLRRSRVQFFGQLTPKVYFYTQFGMNNFTSNSKQFGGAFFHDVQCELKVADKLLSVGGGLSAWSGMSRFASPSVSTILGIDAPLYQQSTNGVNDQFFRKLSVYAKGKIAKLDYRFTISKPMAVQNAVAAIQPLSARSEFSLQPPKLQGQGYVTWQFLDQEDNTNAYNVGTYLGKKRVFNIGTGFIYQPDAMWHLDAAGDTVNSQMLLLGLDVFYDAPINKDKGTALTVYAAYNKFNFGPNYVRNIGVMNPATGTNSAGTFSGAGNAYPMIGTGHTLYAQIGYLFRKELLGEGTFQLYAGSQYSSWQVLDENVLMWETGFNWLVHGTHGAKITLNYQSRPVFEVMPGGPIAETGRKGMIQLQYQVSI